MKRLSFPVDLLRWGVVTFPLAFLSFNGAVQFNDNSAEAFGGGLGIEDGDVM